MLARTIPTKALTNRGMNPLLAINLFSRLFFLSYLLNNTQYFCSRASYASEHVNGGKFEETKKNAVREGKGAQPPSGGANKKRLKSKK